MFRLAQGVRSECVALQYATLLCVALHAWPYTMSGLSSHDNRRPKMFCDCKRRRKEVALKEVVVRQSTSGEATNRWKWFLVRLVFAELVKRLPASSLSLAREATLPYTPELNRVLLEYARAVRETAAASVRRR